jgi:hypothetical protein
VAVDHHTGTPRGSDHLETVDKVLDVCPDGFFGDAGAILQHKAPQPIHVEVVEAQLVDLVDQVLLEASKAVLNHLMDVWAVGWVGQEGARRSPGGRVTPRV